MIIGLALALVLAMVFAVMSYRTAVAVRAETAVLAEFHLGPSLVLALLPFALGPIVLHFGSFIVGLPLAAAIAAACFIPGLLSARRYKRALAAVTTDRVD